MHATQGATADVERGVALRNGGIQVARLKLLGVERPGEPAALVAEQIQLDDPGAGERCLDEPHESSVSSGVRAANCPPHSRMKLSCSMISSFRFHGRISTTSGRASRIASGERIGMWLPGRKCPCLCGFRSQVKSMKSGPTPQ